MSFCPNCYKEGISFNFGSDHKARNAYLESYRCDCGYASEEEMMLDQDLGFSDPRWVDIAKVFLNEYYRVLTHRIINSKDQHIRLFLKELKYIINKKKLSVILVPLSSDESIEYANDGITKKVIQANIFDDCESLGSLPTTIKLDITKNNLLKMDFNPKKPDDLNRIRVAYKQSQKKISELEKKIITQNRWTAFFILLIILIGVCELIF